MSDHESVAQSGEPARRHLGRRLRLYLLVMSLFTGLSFVAITVATVLIIPSLFWENALHPGRLLHLAATAVLWASWALSRRELSERALRALDSFATTATSVIFAFDLATNNPTEDPELVLILVISHMLILRAALVPSTARRSLVLGLVAAAAIFACTIVVRTKTPGHSLLGALTIVGIFVSMTVAASTLVTRVIYGLRQRASEALRLGQYLLEEKIGEGGMGIVYRASHAMLKRPTAVKLIAPSKASPDHLLRFEREVQLTARLTHPNTIAIFDYGRTNDGVFYYAMEYLDGLSLETLVALHGAQPPARVTHVLKQACAALAEAHGVGLVHRDIKPANLMLCRRGGLADVLKVLDFGMVKELVGAEAPKLSKENAVLGTPLFMSPEAITTPEQTDGRSDLYALGAVAYYLLTGTHVFPSSSAFQVLAAHVHSDPEPPSARLGAPLPDGLGELVLRCLRKDVRDRPQSAGEMLAALEALPLVWGHADAEAWWSKHGATSRRAPAQAVKQHLTVDVTRG